MTQQNKIQVESLLRRVRGQQADALHRATVAMLPKGDGQVSEQWHLAQAQYYARMAERLESQLH